MRKIFCLYVLLYFLGGCGNDNSTGLYTNKEKSLSRIISLAPAITEELYLLGADNMLIANTYYCKRPEQAKNKMKIGNLKNFDLEKIVKLAPDLILCTTLANENKIKKLKQLDINVIQLPPSRSFEEICANFLKLGTAVNKRTRAEEIIRNIKTEVEHIRKATMKLPKKKVFMQLGANPLVTVNKDYFINDYIKFAGGINISREAISNRYSRESVLLKNPDVIIITNMGIASDREILEWKRFPSITAVKENNIHAVDSNVFCNPTISTFFESLKKTTNILHPDIKL